MRQRDAETRRHGDAERAQREARDIEIINRNADRLNAEALDVLDYQRCLLVSKSAFIGVHRRPAKI